MVRNIEKDEEGRKIIFDLEQDDIIITIVAVYAPNQDTPIFFKKIKDTLAKRSELKLILGDFNLTLDVEMDRLNTYSNNQRSKEEVENIIEEFLLKDVWRIRNEGRREFSWRKSGDLQKASRIDFALISAGLDQKVKHVQYLSSIKTDHRALYMVIDTQLFERGTGYWKMNTSLLQNKNFVETMNSEIEKTLEASKNKSQIERWETLKSRVKKASIDFSKQQSSEDKLIISHLSELVNDYEANLPLTEDDDKLLLQTKTDLEDKLMERAKGILFRSKVKWFEEGEKNTKYFFSLEKARYNAKTCYKALDDEGGEVSDPQLILDIQRRFYKELYSKDEYVNFTMSNSYGIYVSEGVRLQQEKKLTIQELAEAAKSMNNNKTPGMDGIPVDFYKVFWGKIKTVFYGMVEEVYEEGLLHETARKGILNLIPKANKDTRLVKNLRPITLLNSDYKIIEKAIANKMIPALEEIIHKDQRGFMKERRISVNIRKMLDIMHQAEKEDLEAVIMSLDFVKCFDKCSFDILHGSLEFFKFGEVVREWTKILYKNFTVKIQNNGYFSKEIDIKKGVHQGGCCSSVYFLVIAEILALSLRSNERIEGITFQEIQNLLNQFADDMDVFSLATEGSIKAIHQELNQFRLQSGFTVSYDKTTLYRIGSLRHSSAKLYDIDQFTWSNNDITVLGVTIAHEDIVQKNYQPLIVKVKNILNAWYNRGLSLIGKVQVVNTLVASLFIYKMMVLPTIPDYVVKIIDNIIRDFLWNGKKSKIAYNILQMPKREGGLNLVSLKRRDKALKATWVEILNQEEQYAKMVYNIIGMKFIQEDIWRCTLHPEDISKLKMDNFFWKDVLTAWSEYNSYYNFKYENQLIWYNSWIRVRDKPVFWKDVYQNGLKFVYQLFDNHEFKSNKQVWDEFKLTRLRFNSLKVALPRAWKQYFCENSYQQFSPLPPHLYDLVINGAYKQLSRKIYQYISEDHLLLHGKYMKWRGELGNEMVECLWDYKQEIVNIYKTSNITKYRSFQYRLLQRGIITGIQLFKWGILPTDLCYYCQSERETVLHLFCTCTKVKELWAQVAEYIEQKYSILVKLHSGAIIFNKLAKGNHVANFLCLIVKQYIYSQKCLQRELIFREVKARIMEVQNVEKYIAIKNDKLNVHVKKWTGSLGLSQGSITAFVNDYVQNL